MKNIYPIGFNSQLIALLAENDKWHISNPASLCPDEHLAWERYLGHG